MYRFLLDRPLDEVEIAYISSCLQRSSPANSHEDKNFRDYCSKDDLLNKKEHFQTAFGKFQPYGHPNNKMAIR